MKKIAVCIFGELRGVCNTIDSFNKYIIEDLDADVYIHAQKTNTAIDNNIEYYQKNVCHKVLYDKPDVHEYYKYLDRLRKLTSKHACKDFIYEPALQIYLNFHLIDKILGEKFEKEYLINQLKKNHGNISKTADFIKMERSALHRKLKSLGIKGIN